MAIGCYLALGLLFDHLLFPEEVRSSVWQIRGLALLVPLGVLLLTFHPLFQRFNYLPLAMIGLAGGSGLILMSLHLPADKVMFYYPGLVVVVFFTYNLAGTRFVYALGVDVFLLTAFNLAMLSRADVSVLDLAISDLYILMANLIGGAAGYLNERQHRQVFWGEQRWREQMLAAQAAQEETQRAHQERTRFLASVSHDLRQPVHAQGLFLNLLQKSQLTPYQQELLQHIQAGTTATGEMLHRLMDFSRIEAGAVEPQKQVFLLQPLLNKIEREFMPLAEAKGLNYRSRETQLAVESDPALIEMILRNLVSNALRYTDQGGLLLGCRQRGQSAQLFVRDTGRGIHPKDQEAIFQEFYQLPQHQGAGSKGLGLGLAIVKGLAKTLNHPLELVSSPGRGSRFQLSLPLADPTLVTKPTKKEALPKASPSHSLLLIEDDAAVRRAMSQQLVAWQFECDAVSDLEAALACLQRRQPDLIISDYHLASGLTGIQVIEALRADAGWPIPALLISGNTTPEHLHEANRLSLPLLHKPVEPASLYSTLIKLLNP